MLFSAAPSRRLRLPRLGAVSQRAFKGRKPFGGQPLAILLRSWRDYVAERRVEARRFRRTRQRRGGGTGGLRGLSLWRFLHDDVGCAQHRFGAPLDHGQFNDVFDKTI